MATKDLQALNFKFDQVMLNSLVFTWERNFELMFGIFSVLVSPKNILESYFYFPIRPSLFSRSPGPGGLRGPDAENQG